MLLPRPFLCIGCSSITRSFVPTRSSVPGSNRSCQRASQPKIRCFGPARWIGAAWQPLGRLSLIAELWTVGARHDDFILTNIALHAVVASLLFLVILRVARNALLAACAAGAFAVHPAAVPAVASIGGRTELLAAVFGLLATLWYVDFRRHGRKRSIAASVFCSTASALASPALIALPLLLPLMHTATLRKRASAAGLSRQALLTGGARLEVLVVRGCDAGRSRRGDRGVHRRVELSGGGRNVATSGDLARKFHRHPVGAGHCSALDRRRMAARGAVDTVGYSWSGDRADRYVSGLSHALSSNSHDLAGWLWFIGAAIPAAGIAVLNGKDGQHACAYVPLIGSVTAAVFLVWAVANVRGVRAIAIPLIAVANVAILARMSLVDAPSRLERWGGLVSDAGVATMREASGRSYVEHRRRTQTDWLDAMLSIDMAVDAPKDTANVQCRTGTALENLGDTALAVLYYQLRHQSRSELLCGTIQPRPDRTRKREVVRGRAAFLAGLGDRADAGEALHRDCPNL